MAQFAATGVLPAAGAGATVAIAHTCLLCRPDHVLAVYCRLITFLQAIDHVAIQTLYLILSHAPVSIIRSCLPGMPSGDGSCDFVIFRKNTKKYAWRC
eukprot:1161492-Pelagomonas_calceolata.AAC.3